MRARWSSPMRERLTSCGLTTAGRDDMATAVKQPGEVIEVRGAETFVLREDDVVEVRGFPKYILTLSEEEARVLASCVFHTNAAIGPHGSVVLDLWNALYPTKVGCYKRDQSYRGLLVLSKERVP